MFRMSYREMKPYIKHGEDIQGGPLAVLPVVDAGSVLRGLYRLAAFDAGEKSRLAAYDFCCCVFND
jgi:hypothetical protein